MSLATLMMLNTNSGDETMKKLLQIICFEVSCPTIFLFLAVILATSRPRMIDYFGLSIQLPFTVAAYAFYLVPSIYVETEGPNFQDYVFALIFLCSCHFMSSNYLLTLIIRQVLSWSFIVFNIVMWKQLYQFNVTVHSLFFLACVVLMEACNYCNVRSKAHLFLRMKVLQMQEKQLSSLLDVISDKVLICSRNQEAKAPQGIFSNK